MQQPAALSTLQSLGYSDAGENIGGIAEGQTKVLRGDSGQCAAVSRHGDLFDFLVIGADAERPVDALRAFLESAIIPLSVEYAVDIGMAKPERETLRKRMREAAVALDVLAKGQKVRVRPADIAIHPQIVQYLEQPAGGSGGGLPDGLVNDLALVNQLQTLVLAWQKEINNLVTLARTGPGTVLSAEEETMFWSSLDGAFTKAQTTLAGREVEMSLQLLARHRRALWFMGDVSEVLDRERLKAAGVLNLVQNIPIVPLKTAEDEASLLKATEEFWGHMVSKLRISSLPIERAMSLTDSLSGEVSVSLTGIQKAGGGILNMPYRSFVAFVERASKVFDAWSEGYDRFRIAAREVAARRDETLPVRTPPRFASLRTRIEEAFEFRSHNNALRTVLENQAQASPAAEDWLTKLDAAYQTVVRLSDGGFALDTTNEGDERWASAREAYSSTTEDIEEAIAMQYQEAVCGMGSLEVMARFAVDFKPLVDRGFMEHSTSVCATKVLEIGGSSVAVLRKQWERYRVPKDSSRFRHLPDVCTRIVQARVVNSALRNALEETTAVLGSLRIRNDPDLIEFVEKISSFQKQTDPKEMLKTWLLSSSTISFCPKTPLLLSRSADLESGVDPVELDALRAVFFFENDPLSGLLDQQILTRARDAEHMLQVDSLLRSALASYADACRLAQTMDSREFALIGPLVGDKRAEARQTLQEASKASCDDAAKALLAVADKCLASCRAYADALRALVDEHRFVVESMEVLSGFCFKMEDDGSDASPKQVAELLSRVSRTLRSMRARVSLSEKFETYLTVSVKDLFDSVFDAVLVLSIRHWASTLKNGGIAVMKAQLRLSSLGDNCLLDPDVNSVHMAALAELRAVSTGACNLLRNQEYVEEDDPMRRVRLPSLDACFRENSGASKEAALAIKCVAEELARLQASGQQWSKFTFVFALDKTVMLKSVSGDIEKARDVLSSLSSALEEIRTLKRAASCSAYLEYGTLSTQLQTAVASMIRDALDACLEYGAAQTHEVYRLMSESKSSIKDSLGKDAIDVLLLLKRVEETLFGVTDSKIAALHEIETLIGNTPEVSMAGNWISFDVLTADLAMLKKLHSERSASVLVNLEELGKKYEKEKEVFEGNLSEFHSRSGKVWELYGSVSSPMDKDSTFLALPDCDESLTVLQEEAQDLKRESARLKSIERALEFVQSDSGVLLESLVVEVDKVCTSLVVLRKLADRLRELGSTSFEAFNGRAVRKQVEAISGEVLSLESEHGASAAVSNIRSLTEKHLKVHGLLAHLRTCNLSALRERDVLKTVFGETEGAEPILRKKLSDFWQVDLQKHDAYLREVFDLASGESALAEFMGVVRRTWSARTPTFVRRDGIQLLDGIPALVDELHDQLQALATMAGSQFVALFEEERKSWEIRLSRCQEVLEQISEVQMQWLHLHSLFEAGSAGSSLRKKLQKEYIAFSNVNSAILSFFDALSASAGVVEGLNAETDLDRILSDLGDIVRSLSKFLESQRSAFPRFFFMSDADLLLVLSMSPKRIEELVPSLGKLFGGIGQLEYQISDKNGVVASAVVSKEGERLELCRPVMFEDGSSITDFLSSLDRTMKESLRLLLPKGLQVAEDMVYSSKEMNDGSLRELLGKIPSQIMLLAARILFTEKVDACFSTSGVALDELLKVQTQSLERLCSCMMSDIAEKQSSDPANVKREHIIKDLVYQRDTLKTLISRNVSKISAHEWNHQLRMYSAEETDLGKDSKTVLVKCAEAEFEYGWEYLGVGDTLVQTPLTSRCYLTLSQALHHGLGGSPFGPAGTGKTETVKSLGRLLGRNVVVFNCDESFDAVSVGRILAGVSRVGFWVCFDEFNRLSASSLSATSQQLSVLQTAVKSGYRSVENFYGGEVPISIGKGLGIFITMNPTYSGRRELPSNLKSLFRPCAMPRPDYLIIAEVLLLSYSFRDAQSLGAKLVHLFECLKRVVRSRPHYDFGLRSLKSAIVIAGSLRTSDMEEDRAVVLSLHETLKPRLLPEDVHDYNAYIANLFPSVGMSSLELPEKLQNAVRSACKERNVQVSPAFLERLGQLFNLLKHRPGVMLVGETGCGKSVSWRILFEALRRLEDAKKDAGSTGDRNSSVTVLDPKLMTSAQLYGSLDVTTREWTDGIFTKRLRECAFPSGGSEDMNSLHWIVFDGDIDPNWVENLNSVLDDTKLLTLPSGERIPLSSNIRILFEVDSLKHANPSTVSRCGLVYFDDGEPLSSVLKSKFVSTLAGAGIVQNVSDEILQMVEVFCGFSSSISKYGAGVLKQPQCHLISGVMTMFSSMLTQLLSKDSSKDEGTFSRSASGQSNGQSNGAALSCSTVAHCLLFSVKTVIGSSFCQEDAVGLFSALLKHMTGCSHFLDKILDEFDGSSLLGGAFDCKTESLCNFRTMASEEMVLESLPDDIGSPDIVIPTASTMRLTHIVRDAIWNQESLQREQSMVVLCGPPGCGKSMVLTSALNELPGVQLCTISMSSRTTVLDIVSVLKAHMESSKNLNGEVVLRPKSRNKQTVLFCDEVNLGEPDDYGTQHVASFLRCLVERNGFWNGSPLRWTNVVGLRVVAACNPAEDAGRHELPARLMRHAVLVRVEQPDRHDLLTIFKVHISGLLKYLDVRLEDRSGNLTNAMVDFFLANKQRFAPSSTGPVEPHYVYSARELIRWVRGMKHILTCNMQSSGVLRSMGSSSRDLENVWEDIVRAFCHEARRLFMDRLVSELELDFAEASLAQVLQAHLGHGRTKISDTMYTSWLKSDGDEAVADVFQPVTYVEEYRAVVYAKLRVFAEEEGLGGSWTSGRGAAPLEDTVDQFAVTDDVLKHLARIERVLSLPLGHAVLMGVPGTGKKTLARFAAWMVGATVFQVRSHAGYTAIDFANDLRNVLRQAGVYHHKMVVIFDESNDLDSAFLEMMNSILACGDVPGLFEGDDKAALLKEIQENQSRTSASDATVDALYMQFLDGVRANLHVIFTIPIVHEEAKSSGDASEGSSSKDLTSRSPALYNRCIVDWFGDWDSETVENVAALKTEVSRGEIRQGLVLSMVRIHNIAKQHFRSIHNRISSPTPRHFLEFIEQLNRIATEKGEFVNGGVARYQEGIAKLQQAGDAVDDLKDSLSEKTIHLTQKEAEANETLRQMSEEQRLAEKSKIDAEKLAVAAEESAEAAQVQQDEVTLKLAAVEPKVAAAREAVGSIRKENLDEVRAMPNPPAGVRAALDAVLILLDVVTQGSIGTYTWGQIRSKLRDREFIPSILNFDTESIPVLLIEQMDQKIFDNPDFDVERISFASQAAGPLAEWTVAILDYAAVQQTVAPLRDEVELLQADVDELMLQSEEAKKSVVEMEKRIEQCRSQYAVLVGEAERVRGEIQDAEGKLEQAESMLNSLGDEWERWVVELQKHNEDAVKVFGNALFAAAFVAYAGPLDQQQRKSLRDDWCRVMQEEGVLFDGELNFSNYLTSAEDRAFWTRQNLPTDETSLENYAILSRSARYPLIVDPSGASSELLRSILGISNGRETPVNKEASAMKHASSSIGVTSFAQAGKKSYIRSVESAVRFGTTVLIEHAERFDYTVLPLLGQESSFGSSGQDQGKGGAKGEMKRSQQRLIRLGDKDVALSPGFRMFLATASPKEVPTAALSRSAVVSFALSAAALKTKCISRTLTALQPAIEEQRTTYITASLECGQRKKELEDALLIEINKAEDVGAELLSGTLLATLSNLKQETIRVNEQEAENNAMAEEAKQYEEKFQCLAKAALSIFNVLENLQHLSLLYRFSPVEFFYLFDSALVEATKTGYDPAPSPFDIHRELVRTVFLHVVPSLFPQHKLAFASALVIGATLFKDDTSKGFLGPEHLTELQAILSKLSSGGMANESGLADDLKLAQQLSLLMNADSKAEGGDECQKSFAHNAAQPLSNILAIDGDGKGSLPLLFDQLATILPGGKSTLHGPSTRADVVLSKLMESLVGRDTQVNVRSKEALYRPLLLCSKGANSDPCQLVNSVASQLSLGVESIALSNEHTAEVLSNIFAAAARRPSKEPFVLLMKNIHLASRKVCERLKREITKTQEGLPYQLVMAAEVTGGASPYFALADDCRVLAFEVPSSLRTNLSRCHAVLNASLSDDWLRRTYIAVTWLHGALLERRQYSPVGFSKPYGFSEGDLVSAWNAVMNHHQSGTDLKSDHSVSALIHLLSTTVYGGRVECQADVQVLHEFVSDLMRRVLLKEADSKTVSVVDASHVQKNISIAVDDPLMLKMNDELPQLAPTDWFGMPPKTSEGYKIREGLHITNVFVGLLPGQSQERQSVPDTATAGNSTKQNLDMIQAVLAGLPDVQAVTQSQADYGSALKRYFQRELELCVECIGYMRTDLENLRDVINGSCRESPRSASLLAEVVLWNSHCSSKLPAEWGRFSGYAGAHGTIRGLLSKLRHGHEWLTRMLATGDVGDKTVNMTFALRPSSLVSALGQFEADQVGVAENKMQLTLGTQRQVASGDSWRLKGVLLEGGDWNGKRGVVEYGDGSLNEVTDCRLWWGDEEARGRCTKEHGVQHILLPLYSSATRERLVCEVFVPVDTAVATGKWRLSATAMIVASAT